MKKLIKLFLVSGLMLFILSGVFAGGAKEEAGKQYIFRIGNVVNLDHPSSKMLVEIFIPAVEKKLGDRIKFTYYPSGQLGGQREMLEAVKIGNLEAVVIGGLLQGVEPRFAILELPYLFTSHQHAFNVVDGPIGKEINDLLKGSGLMRLDAWGEWGFRNLTNSKRPINSVGDIKGLKIRTPESPTHIGNLRALGANVTPISFAELYTALQQGVIDGQENPLPTIYAAKFHEVQEHIAITEHMWGEDALTLNEKWWDTLPKDMQKVIQEAYREACLYERDLIKNEDERYLKLLKDGGMVVTYPDKEPFIEAVQVQYEEFYKKYGDWGRDIVKRIRATKAN